MAASRHDQGENLQEAVVVLLQEKGAEQGLWARFRVRLGPGV